MNRSLHLWDAQTYQTTPIHSLMIMTHRRMRTLFTFCICISFSSLLWHTIIVGGQSIRLSSPYVIVRFDSDRIYTMTYFKTLLLILFIF